MYKIIHVGLESRLIVTPGTCRRTSPVGFETEGKQEEGANLLSKIFVLHLLSSLRISFSPVSVQSPEEADLQLCLERGAVYGARTASGLMIFRWRAINFNFFRFFLSKLHYDFKGVRDWMSRMLLAQ